MWQCCICGGTGRFPITREDTKKYCEFCNQTIDEKHYRPLTDEEIQMVQRRQARKETVEHYLASANGHDLYIVSLHPKIHWEMDHTTSEWKFWDFNSVDMWKKGDQITHWRYNHIPAPGLSVV